ncbi:MAG: hypothetical protein FD153_1538 [Rhodospirillaceae bacterium]|nr:MAG: hypothetical protein FD153_1538 [Rhodospirillaceae bacterium]
MIPLLLMSLSLSHVIPPAFCFRWGWRRLESGSLVSTAVSASLLSSFVAPGSVVACACWAATGATGVACWIMATICCGVTPMDLGDAHLNGRGSLRHDCRHARGSSGRGLTLFARRNPPQKRHVTGLGGAARTWAMTSAVTSTRVIAGSAVPPGCCCAKAGVKPAMPPMAMAAAAFSLPLVLLNLVVPRMFNPSCHRPCDMRVKGAIRSGCRTGTFSPPLLSIIRHMP